MGRSERCDVLIVGGGPAGSTCAAKLRQAGRDVLVLDRAVFPRDKLCAGWVTPQVFVDLGLRPEEYCSRGRTLQTISAFRAGLAGGPLHETTFSRPLSYGIRRCELDTFLLERSGARVQMGAAATTIQRTVGGWLVNGEIEARLLVGAGGHFCPVARFLGARPGEELCVTAQEVEVEVGGDCGVPPGVPEISFCRDLGGYGWCFRKGSWLNVGFGRLGSRDLPGDVRAYVDVLKSQGKVPTGLELAFRGHAYLLYETSRRPLLDDRALLVGDAAGLAFPKSGEGIRTAVESGLLAAKAILEANGDYGRERLARYAELVEARFGPRRAGIDHVRPGWLAPLLAPALLAMPWFRRHVLLESWFLRADEAPLG